jgi:hypothetical protein
MKIFRSHTSGFGKDNIRYRGAVYRAYKVGWWFITTRVVIEYSEEERTRAVVPPEVEG